MAESAATVLIGTETTIAFADSGYAANLLNIDWSGITREAIDSTAMGTTIAPKTVGNRIFVAAGFVDGGELTVEVQFNPDETPPMVPATVENSEVITMTFPKGESGDTSAANWAFSGYCKSFDVTCPMEGIMTATLGVRVTAGVEITTSVV